MSKKSEKTQSEKYWITIRSFLFLISIEVFILFVQFRIGLFLIAVGLATKKYITNKGQAKSITTKSEIITHSWKNEIVPQNIIFILLLIFIMVIPAAKLGETHLQQQEYLNQIKPLSITVENLSGLYVGMKVDFDNMDTLIGTTLTFSPDGNYEELILDNQGEHKKIGRYQITDNLIMIQVAEQTETYIVELKENTNLSSANDSSGSIKFLNLSIDNVADATTEDPPTLEFSGVGMGDETSSISN